MALSETRTWRTQRWPDEEALRELDLRFQPVLLASLETGCLDAGPWGFVVGPLAVHPIVHALDNASPETTTRWRVSARESGAAVGDFDRIEQALGFVAEAKEWDWSGSLASIADRLKDLAVPAYAKWSRFGYEEAPS